jgi:hypothetical protein
MVSVIRTAPWSARREVVKSEHEPFDALFVVERTRLSLPIIPRCQVSTESDLDITGFSSRYPRGNLLVVCSEAFGVGNSIPRFLAYGGLGRAGPRSL